MKKIILSSTFSVILVVFLFSTNSAEASYNCSLGGSYPDQASCNASCKQTANCISGSSIVLSKSQTNKFLTNAIIGNGNSIEFRAFATLNVKILISNASVNGTAGLQPVPARILKLVGNGSTIDVYFYGYAKPQRFLTVTGATVSGNLNIDWTGSEYPNVYGSGNRIYSTNGNTYLEFLPLATCPLSGGSACSGSPATCSAPGICSCVPAWTPNPATVCAGVWFSQDDGCGNTQMIAGTKICTQCLDSIDNDSDGKIIPLNN